MKTWTNQVSNCAEYETIIRYLKNIPIVLLSATEYIPDVWYWLEYGKVYQN